MPQIIHTIDPDADTVIILTNPAVNFATWGPDEPEMPPEPFETVPDEDLDVEQPDIPPPAPGEFVIEESAVSGAELEDEEIWYYVSSRHLKLASPQFATLLSKGKWREGTQDDSDGRYHIPAKDWDTEAFLLLLKILHHRNREVPRTVSLEMFAKVAVVADYYECTEAIEMFTERWVEFLKSTHPVPETCCRDLMLWMCVAWVFKFPEEFTRATEPALRRGEQDLWTLGLPITRCADRIDQARQQAIDKVICQLHDLRQKYSDLAYECSYGDSFDCGSVLYGALTRGMKRAGLHPRPVTPFLGLTISELDNRVKRITSPAWTASPTRRFTSHPCQLNNIVIKIANSAFMFARGLELKDFEST